jgi:hypothetical protein
LAAKQTISITPRRIPLAGLSLPGAIKQPSARAMLLVVLIAGPSSRAACSPLINP